MKIIRNNILPLKGFAAINLFGVVFVRKSTNVTNRLINHEKIHTQQIKELWYVAFYPVYLYLWARAGFSYELNPMELEAYANETNYKYISVRKKFAWKSYKKLTSSIQNDSL